MATLRVTNLKGRTGINLQHYLMVLLVTGVTTSTSFDGSASLTNLNATQLASGTDSDARLQHFLVNSGALPALDGSALTNLNIPAGFNELDAALFN